MGYREISLRLPIGFQPQDIHDQIEKTLNLREFSWQTCRQALDARKKTDIHWLITVGVSADALPPAGPEPEAGLSIPYHKRHQRVVVVGSGPAGFFAAFVLQRAGFDTIILERGAAVSRRAKSIQAFENTGAFDPVANYAFGEGGAGTFSDGKLTARSKRISLEKRFIIESYIQAGAPKEIQYLAHPHIGSDILRKVVGKLRAAYIAVGGEIRFETQVLDIGVKNGRVHEAATEAGQVPGDWFLMAPGNSALDTWRMLMAKGVRFQTKGFAIGCRVEHPQPLINLAQWGRESLPGVKAAEYRLTFKAPNCLPVYTFCMCPGGVVVPATAFEKANIVNGMSRYRRNGAFANAACVAGVHPDQLWGKTVSPLDALDRLEALEQAFYAVSSGYQAPACAIRDFVHQTSDVLLPPSSYPLGLKPAPLWDLLPEPVSRSIRAGLLRFNRQIRGFDTGVIMGLESKTSSPIQAIRDEHGLCAGFFNLCLVGEGSGHSGGIISSAADGIRTALGIARKMA